MSESRGPAPIPAPTKKLFRSRSRARRRSSTPRVCRRRHWTGRPAPRRSGARRRTRPPGRRRRRADADLRAEQPGHGEHAERDDDVGRAEREAPSTEHAGRARPTARGRARTRAAPRSRGRRGTAHRPATPCERRSRRGCAVARACGNRGAEPGQAALGDVSGLRVLLAGCSIPAGAAPPRARAAARS